MFIEQIMIFALGFLSAGLLTLLFLPAFWRRAMTLSKRRLEMQMPLSMAEIVAERDQLRAEFTADQRRLEQRLESTEAGRSQDKIELGKRMIQGVTLAEDLAATRRESAETASLLETATRAIAQAEAELSTTAKQLYDVESALERRGLALAELSTRHEALTTQSNEQRTSIAGLETQLAGREADLEALQRDLSGLRIELSEAHSSRDLLTLERDQFRFDARNVQARREALQLEFEALGRTVEELNGQIRMLEKEKTRLASENADALRLLEGERKKVRDFAAQIGVHDEALKALENKAAQEAELARASKAALEGALDAQRRENENFRSEIASQREEIRKLSASSGKSADEAPIPFPLKPVEAAHSDFPALRKAISEIGQEIARISEMQKAPAAEPRKPSAPSTQAHTSAAE